MRLSVDRETGCLYLTAETLSAFARNKGRDPEALGFRYAEAADTGPISAPAEMPGPSEAVTCFVSSTAEGVLPLGDGVLVKTERTALRRVAPDRLFRDPAFLAEAILNAYVEVCAGGYEKAVVQLAVYNEKTGETAAMEREYGIDALRRVFADLFSRAEPFLVLESERKLKGRADLAALRFPYTDLREGQRDFIEAAYRAVKRHERLLVSAPTGIGKTMSAVYPALRALGAGFSDRVFYFTAKTVTGNAALDALRTLGAQAPHLRGIRIAAKERCCPGVRENPGYRRQCRICHRLGAVDGVSYEERRDSALLSLLTEGRVYDTAEIEKTAAAYTLCPYELSLDLSEYCEMIVADYGYLFDPRVLFRRYFAEERGENSVFLIDEAHNLPDRLRDIYSATLGRKAFAAFAEEAKAASPEDRDLADALAGMTAMFDGLEALCRENGETTDSEGESRGCILEKTVPDFVLPAVVRLRTVLYAYVCRDSEGAFPLFLDTWTELRRFTDAVSRADERFAFYAEQSDGETLCRILCLDPAAMADEALKKGVSSILFSATLSPMDYYADVCGSPGAKLLDLPSPYDPERLCLVTVDGVSTRFSQRKSTFDEVAELISAVTESHPGNYIVYFPSYAYMTAVCRRYLAAGPSGATIMQKQGMSLRERDRFLRAFAKAEASGESLVAFCVLGGVFSEGIDLTGEKLIGSIIVGMGLPGLSSERNILTEYYERTRESGREYAYVYPAMNKILQAAGRVIRSDTDRGVVVLLDDRYADPAIRKLFPAHWSRMQYTGDPASLTRILERFWEREEENAR